MPDINLIKRVITRAATNHFPISVLILLTAGKLCPPPTHTLKEEMGETPFNLTRTLSTKGHPKTSFLAMCHKQQKATYYTQQILGKCSCASLPLTYSQKVVRPTKFPSV